MSKILLKRIFLISLGKLYKFERALENHYLLQFASVGISSL